MDDQEHLQLQMAMCRAVVWRIFHGTRHGGTITLTHRIRMYAKYMVTFTYIYHQHTPVLLASIYHTYGSVMGHGNGSFLASKIRCFQ